jgi:hypothetical protein
VSQYPETIITEALFAHLATMPGLATLLQSSTSTPPIAYPNAAFTPPKDATTGAAKPYLRVYDAPSPPDGIDLPGRYIRRGGTLQVSVFWPLGVGIMTPKEAAGAIGAHFSLNTIIERGTQRIRISQPPRVTSEIVESDIMSIPVLIQYDVLP